MEGLSGIRDAISGLEPLVLDVGRVGCGRQFDQQVAAFINREHFAFVFGKVGLICKIKTKLVGIRDLPEVLIWRNHTQLLSVFNFSDFMVNKVIKV